MIVAGIEAGGTKFVCGIADTNSAQLLDRIQLPTSEDALATIDRAIDYLTPYRADLAAIGIAAFSPIDLIPESNTYGFVLSTPKPGWNNVDFVGRVRRAFPAGIQIGFDTDVNAPALAEKYWGSCQDLNNLVYITVGTGIGGGGIINGSRIHGLLHSEMGHMRIPHDYVEDPFEGVCPFHLDCWEGLASGPAISQRWAQPAPDLSDDHPAWRLEARYLALGICNIICTLSPERIVVGGGVMRSDALVAQVQKYVSELLAGYIQAPRLLNDIENYIVRSQFGSNAGVLGALALANEALAFAEIDGG